MQKRLDTEHSNRLYEALQRSKMAISYAQSEISNGSIDDAMLSLVLSRAVDLTTATMAARRYHDAL